MRFVASWCAQFSLQLARTGDLHQSFEGKCKIIFSWRLAYVVAWFPNPLLIYQELSAHSYLCGCISYTAVFRTFTLRYFLLRVPLGLVFLILISISIYAGIRQVIWMKSRFAHWHYRLLLWLLKKIPWKMTGRKTPFNPCPGVFLLTWPDTASKCQCILYYN